MAQYGYSHVKEKAYLAFLHELGEGAWAEVSTKGYDSAQRMLPSNPLEVPRDVAWKLRASWTIATLRDALGASPELLAELDAAWDSTQRKLYHVLGSASEDKDPEVRAAAERLKGALLEGAGIAQTNLSYDEEVDFGRHQAALMSKGPRAEDVKRLGLGAVRAEIQATTEALARGLGRGPGEQRTGARYKRVRAAARACAAAFNGIHGEIAWFVEHTPQGKARKRLEKMLAPLQALLERYPAPAGEGAPEEEAPAPAPVTVEATAAG